MRQVCSNLALGRQKPRGPAQWLAFVGPGGNERVWVRHTEQTWRGAGGRPLWRRRRVPPGLEASKKKRPVTESRRKRVTRENQGLPMSSPWEFGPVNQRMFVSLTSNNWVKMWWCLCRLSSIKTFSFTMCHWLFKHVCPLKFFTTQSTFGALLGACVTAVVTVGK